MPTDSEGPTRLPGAARASTVTDSSVAVTLWASLALSTLHSMYLK
jgi:hypothetical protein